MNGAELLVACLEKEGISFAFGVPGEENADLMFALENSSITFINTRHEQGAAFMAEFYGRLTGEPALCIATLGPGATNLLTAVADANMDRAPLIAIAGQGAVRRLHKESHQIINIEDLFQPITKWSIAVRDGESIPELVRKAVRLARSEKPGAVLLELPEDIAHTQLDESEPLRVKRFKRPLPDPVTTNEVFDRLKNAKQPIIIAGNGAIRTRASRELRRLCDLTGIGVMSTFMGKGAVDKDADYCLFTIGLTQKDIIINALEESDLILTIGYDMVEYPPEIWNPGCNTDVVHIDFYPAEIDKNYQPAIELVGDIAGGLRTLSEKFIQSGIPDYDLKIQNSVRTAMLDDFAEHAKDDTQDAIRPQKVIWDVRDALGPNDVLMSGVGAHKLWVARYYHCHEPNTCLIPNGFCSMGAVLPGAIGASIAQPDINIVAIVGDGDFLMNVQEMETAKRLESNITMLIWEDFGYGLIEWKQQQEFGKHTDLSFNNPDWNKLASAFGWNGRYVNRSTDLSEALKESITHKGPSMIVVPIDYRENDKLIEKLGKVTMRV